MSWRSLVLVLCFLSVGCGMQPEQSDALSLLRDANTAYLATEYERAIDLYEQLVEGGVEDATVFYNLGTAYFQHGELGMAMLSYRRAAVLAPRDGDVQAGLLLVRAVRQDQPGDLVGSAEHLAAVTDSSLTLDELAWLVLVVWSAWFALLFAYLLRQIAWLRWLLIGGLSVLVIALLLLGGRMVVERYEAAIVMRAGVAVMSGPGADYLEHFDLHVAAEVRILDVHGDWVRFLLPDGRQGWIPRNAVEII